MMWQKALILIGMTAMVSACASPKEKEARQNNAFDLEGEYTATRSKGSETNMVIKIVNQTNRSDVRAEVSREITQEPQEAAFLKSQGLNPMRVADFFGTKMTMGTGSNDTLDGGKNISVDFGDSSDIGVCSQTFNYDSTHRVLYCLHGTIKKSDYVLRGSLILRVITETRKKDDKGQEIVSLSVAQNELKYAASTQNVYFTQYFGQWSGTLSLAWGAATDLRANNMFTIRRLNETSFEVVPAQSSVTVRGVVYTYVPQIFSIAEVKDQEVPMIEIVYQRPGHEDDRVVILGQIYSLGKLTGSLVHISGRSEEQIAAFSLVRK